MRLAAAACLATPDFPGDGISDWNAPVLDWDGRVVHRWHHADGIQHARLIENGNLLIQTLQIGTNHLGHFALTGLLVDRLLATPQSRIVTVSSVAIVRAIFGSMTCGAHQHTDGGDAGRLHDLALLMRTFGASASLKDVETKSGFSLNG